MTETYLKRDGRPDLAYNYSAASARGKGLPTVVFMGGYRSDKEGSKALYLEEQCKKRGQAYLRFDYSAHGRSGGEFKQESLTSWREDARAVIETLTQGPLVLLGSSMGGWLALSLAKDPALSQRMVGLVGIAAAPDFTRGLMEEFSEAQKKELEEKGYVELPNDYSDEPYIFTKALIESGEELCLLDKQNIYDMPVRLIQGMKDDDVPWQTAYRMKNAVVKGDVEVLLVEQGDHRMSQPDDLRLIDEQVRKLSGIAVTENNLSAFQKISKFLGIKRG